MFNSMHLLYNLAVICMIIYIVRFFLKTVFMVKLISFIRGVNTSAILPPKNNV